MQSFLTSRPVLKCEKSSPASEKQPSFQPLYTPGRKESLDIPHAAGIASEPVPEAPAEPKVEIISGDGRIERIIVTCTCCRRIELSCEY